MTPKLNFPITSIGTIQALSAKSITNKLWMAYYMFNFELQNKILSIVLLRPRLFSGLVWFVVVIACLNYSQDKKPKTDPKMICSNKEKTFNHTNPGHGNKHCGVHTAQDQILAQLTPIKHKIIKQI